MNAICDKMWEHTRRCAFAVVLIGSSTLVSADPISIGASGINASVLMPALSGRGIGIGQVEPERPGLPGFDGAVNINTRVTPAAVFKDAGAPVANGNVSNHAEGVAGIMIGTGAGAMVGLAPKASLFSAAVTGPIQTGDALATQNVAHQNSGDVRAINLSYGVRPAGGNGVTNGNDLFTQFVDWSARRDDVLYVVAGNETGPSYGFNVPRDNYNGITVAATSLLGGAFRQIADYNRFNQPPTDGRRVISLSAPGTNINMAALNEGTQTDSGTSFAAPHVVGTVALLQEYADRQIRDHGWSVFANSHQVMKAILLNSAEKLKLTDAPNATLRSDKELLRTDGKTWLDSYPAQFPVHSIPVDDQMGLGQLDADRALYEFKQGEWGSFAPINYAGWDFDSISGQGSFKKYSFAQRLLKDSYLSATLVWDRIVDLNDWGNDGKSGTGDTGENNFLFDLGESFTSQPLMDLDLYLMHKGETDLANAITASVSSLYNLEHLFFKLPETGDYELWIRESRAGGLESQHYALAWRAVAAVPSPNTALLIFAGFAAWVLTRRQASRL